MSTAKLTTDFFACRGRLPDVVVDVISPTDRYDGVANNLYESLDPGVRLVWMIDREHRAVMMYRGSGGDPSLNHCPDALCGQKRPIGISLPARLHFPAAR